MKFFLINTVKFYLKKDLFQKIKPLLQLGDAILNTITDTRFIWNKQKPINNFEYIQTIDHISDDFFIKHQKHNWIKRSKKEINWIIQYPWLMQGTDSEQLSKRYYFSCIEKTFETKIVQFKNDNGEIIALLILNIKNKHLTVPYLFGEEKDYPMISSFIYNLMSSNRLNMFTIYHSEFCNYLSKRKTPFLFSKEMKKPYFISKKFEALQTLYFQDGDGDCAFY